MYNFDITYNCIIYINMYRDTNSAEVQDWWSDYQCTHNESILVLLSARTPGPIDNLHVRQIFDLADLGTKKVNSR